MRISINESAISNFEEKWKANQQTDHKEDMTTIGNFECTRRCIICQQCNLFRLEKDTPGLSMKMMLAIFVRVTHLET